MNAFDMRPKRSGSFFSKSSIAMSYALPDLDNAVFRRFELSIDDGAGGALFAAAAPAELMRATITIAAAIVAVAPALRLRGS